jgi:hypothetical protein
MSRWVYDRLFDLIMAGAMIGLATQITVWPGTIEASAFRYLNLAINSSNVRDVLMVGGVLRIAALIANGHWPVYGPSCRAAGALMAAVIWAMMTFSLWVLHNEVGNPPSPGISVYAMLTFGELLSFYRALRKVFQAGTWPKS